MVRIKLRSVSELRPTGYRPKKTPMPLHEELGIKTKVVRLPVLAHLEQHRSRPPLYLYDRVNNVLYGSHCYRASVTLVAD